MNKRTSVPSPSPSPSEGNARPHRMLLCRQDAIISDHGICMHACLAWLIEHNSMVGGGRDCLRPALRAVATVPRDERGRAGLLPVMSLSGVTRRGRAARTYGHGRRSGRSLFAVLRANRGRKAHRCGTSARAGSSAAAAACKRQTSSKKMWRLCLAVAADEEEIGMQMGHKQRGPACLGPSCE
jgi:hypothetical protein